MKPTIGRIVHYYPRNRSTDEPPWAAIITDVGIESTCNLTAFPPRNFDRGEEGAEPMGWTDFSDVPKAGCWSWPPRVS